MATPPPSICFISVSAYGYFDSAAPTGGGAQRQVWLLSQELARSFDVSIVVGDYGQSPVQHRDGVTLIRAYRPDRAASFIEECGQFLQLLAAMRRADADVYVYRGNPRKAAVVSLLASALRSGWVYNVANDADLGFRVDALSWPFHRLFTHAVERADAVIAQTRYQQSIVESDYGGTAVVVPNGYPPAADLLPYRDRESVLWVGSMDEAQKRPHLFLDLAERHPESDFRLVGGPNDPTSRYASRIRDRSSSLTNVTYVGRVPPDEIHDEYKRAIAVVNTSAYEGFPNTFLEAWRYGTPVLSLEIDTGRYLGGQSIGFAHGDVERLSELLDHVLHDVDVRNRLGSDARRYFESNYTIESVARRYAAVLRSVMNQ